MADFMPPSGPPPPKVPEGWKAQWNEQYKEWFYVNLYTKQSQWERPTEPIYGPPGGDAAPAGPPPGYDHSRVQPGGVGGPEKGYGSNNPYAHNVSDDEAYARKLQEEENARAQASGSRGAANSYYSGGGAAAAAPQAPQYGSQYGNELPPRDQDRGKSKGFLGKILGKTSSSSSRPPQKQYYSGAPQGQYGYAPQQNYYGQGGYPPQQQQYYAQQQQQKKHGLGAGGGAALGVGAGLLGGAVLMEAFDHEENQAYDQGYDQGYDNGGGGDDYGDGGGGGDDFGGGDF